jgi:transglutaminase-like putative cysteine protease
MRYGPLTLLLTLLPGMSPADETVSGVDGNYESQAFAYRVEVPMGTWFKWPDLQDEYTYADSGYLGIKGYGAVVMPVCWQGDRPPRTALLEIFMQRFGESYPTSFIQTETDVTKDSATGSYLVGNEAVDDEEYTYHFWIVANDSCAYSFAAWGPAANEDTIADLQALWQRFEITGSPVIFEVHGPGRGNATNAFFLSKLGMHYFESRSYREAFRFLSQAADLDRNESTYLMNALRVLTEIDAYQEAYAWLQDRISYYGDDLVVRSWDAWLAYQTDDPDKAIRIYDEIFTAGYREDDEFAVYAGLLADREEWEKLEADFAEYSAGESNIALRKLEADLLTRRGRYEEALAILEALSEGRPFSADLVYSQIEAYDELGSATDVLRLADLLIDKNYRSLESYFYKGYAEYQLKSYARAKESFTAALKYSPTSAIIREYLDSINGILGEGENASISEPVEVVPLPESMQALVDDVSGAARIEGYGAYFINRITGYAFDDSESLTRTQLQQIKVQDAQGIEQYSTLEFDFDPAFEQFYVNRLVVRNAAGEIVAEGDPSAYYVTSVVDGYEASTEKTAHLPVPSLAPGVIIEVVVSKTTNVQKNEFPLDIHYLSASRPIVYSAIFVTGRHEELRHLSFGIGEPVIRDNSLVWEKVNPVVYRWEPMQPYYDRMLPWVTLGTTSENWNEAGADYLAKIEEKLVDERVADTARRLVRGIDDNRRKIEAISRYVQKELHYEAIEFGRRAYVPKSARETLRDRYGDCKDHSVLLYTMLNAVEIPARLALVNTNQRVLPEMPNIDQFDHMIVSVPIDGTRLYIDTTDKDLSLGRTPPRYLAGNHALVLAETSKLLRIPDFAVGDSGLQVEREIEPVAENELKVVEIGVFSGHQAADLRGQLREIESSEMLATMQRWVADRYSGAIVDDAFVDNVFEADSELVVELQYRLSLDDESFRLPGFFEATFLDYDRLPDRRFGFELIVPFSVSTVTTVRYSEAGQLAIASRKPSADESRFGSWHRKIDDGDNSWVLKLEYTSAHAEFAAEDYGAFADFHRRLIGSIEQPVVIE